MMDDFFIIFLYEITYFIIFILIYGFFFNKIVYFFMFSLLTYCNVFYY